MPATKIHDLHFGVHMHGRLLLFCAFAARPCAAPGSAMLLHPLTVDGLMKNDVTSLAAVRLLVRCPGGGGFG